MFLWFHISNKGRINGRAATLADAQRDAIKAGGNVYGATIRVENASSGILLEQKRFRFGTVEGTVRAAWFPHTEW